MLVCTIVIVICFSLTNGQVNSTIVRQARTLLSSFDEIHIDGTFDVYLSQIVNKSSMPSVEIETTVDAQRDVIVEIIDHHILSIRLSNSFQSEKNIYASIRFDSPLHRYTIKGTGNTLTDDTGISNTNNDRFILDNRGVANIAMGINVNTFEVHFTGSGNSRFWGQVREQAIFDGKGAGDINAFTLSSKRTIVRVTGISIVRVAATDDIQIDATGVSTVFYRLSPGKQPSKAISSGFGKIVPIV